MRELVCRVAKTPRRQLGLPFTTWSLSKLVEHLRTELRVVASTETVRAIVHVPVMRWRATKTWKASQPAHHSDERQVGESEGHSGDHAGLAQDGDVQVDQP